MSKMHNLGTVIKFEMTRTLKKVSFWAMALGFPLMFVVLYGIMFWSNAATREAAEKLQQQKFSVLITDETKMIKPEMIAALGAKEVTDKAAAVEEVRSGATDAYFYIPADLATQKVEIHGQDAGLFENGKYSGVVEGLLQQSVGSSVTPSEKAVLQKKVRTTSIMYQNGKEHDAVREMIAPGFFLVLFYLLVSFFGNQMLTSTTEEKENRTVEMLLTTVQATTLITGKIISLVFLGLIQVAIIIIPVLIGYLKFGSSLQLPGVDLTSLVFDPMRISLAVIIFVASFMMFTGLLVALGAMMPTAKEAGSWFGLVILSVFGPLYGAPMFVSYPESLFVQVLSYFPLTAPIPLMLRNAIGNLPLHEALIGVAILTVSAVLITWVAVRIFRYGAMSYDSKLSLSVLRARRSEAK